MHAASLAREAEAAPSELARRGSRDWLVRALRDSRADTLATFAAYEAALPGLIVPQREELNLPLWELGHVGWFQGFQVTRNPARGQGHRADPDAPRRAPRRADADALYHSSLVPHGARWSLPLPDAATTRREIAAQLDELLAQLAALPANAGDDALYFFRLALLHEDMHHEAALYMAQGLGVAITDPRWQPAALPAPAAPLRFAAGEWRLGSAPEGFAFDNELPAQRVSLAAFEIDAQVLRWAEFLPFVEDGGYDERRWWTEQGWAWRSARGATAPRFVERGAGGGWRRQRYGRWEALVPEQAASHLSLHEALAWCRWAGRRLPTEAEWERAAVEAGPAFAWGEVWEWTASAFAPYPGFRAHPYRDYSAPWFDGRPVLRGASCMTQPRLRHARYRNYFLPHRHDVPAGLRTVAC
jgi:ergothioneine biosynthesis protein EgtB